MDRNPRLGVGLAVTTAVLWGTIPVAGKYALFWAGPYWISAVRLLGSALVLGVVLHVFAPGGRPSLLRPPRLALVAAAGLLGNYILYWLGLELTTASDAQLVIQTASVFLLLWGVLVFREPLTRARGVGALAALAGVALVTWDGRDPAALLASDHFVGNLLVAAAGFTWSFYAASQKVLNRRFTSSEVLLYVYVFAGLASAPALALDAPVGWQWGPALAVGYLVLNTLVAYGAFAESLKHVDATVTATITTLSPLVTMATVLLAERVAPGLLPPEPLDAFTAAGAALIIGGVVLVVRGVPARALPGGVPAPPE